jgi:hypothetical protein
MKKGVDKIVKHPRRLGWQISDEYIIAGVVIIPIVNPLIDLAIINSINNKFTSFLLENPIMIHWRIEMKLMKTKVPFLPILFDK